MARIEKDGQEDSKRLLEALEVIRPSMIKLRFLVAKGQIFSFKAYARCHRATAVLTWHFDRMEAFAVVVSRSTLNWKHPLVLKQLKDIMAIDPEEMNTSIQENHVNLLEFSQETYSQIYG